MIGLCKKNVSNAKGINVKNGILLWVSADGC